MALLVNYFALIDVYGNLSIHLGNVFVYICLLTRGTRPAIITFLLSSLGLSLSTLSSTIVLLTAAELVTIILLCRRGMLLIVADMLFWALVGIPATFIVLLAFYDISSGDFTQIILIKQALNGLLYTSIATMVKAFVPFRWYSSVIKENPPRLSNRVLELCLICIAIPSLIVMLIISDNSADRLERELIEEIDIRAEHLRERVEGYQSFHVKAMKTFAFSLGAVDSEQHKQDAMKLWIDNYPGFLTMMSTDRFGQVINGVPSDVFDKLLELPDEARNVSDRDYFKIARDTRKAYVSDVFKGRGVGSDPIVAVSVPLFKGSAFLGVVEGSLNLPRFETIDNSGSDSSILVVDSKGQVIYGSADLGLEPLDLVSIKENSQQYSNSIKSMILNDERVFNYKYIETSSGWLIYILSPFDELLVAYRNNFYGLLLGIIIISLIALRAAHRLSLHITSPLERLVSYFSAGLPVPEKTGSYYSSKEIETVRMQLQEAQHIMIDFQEELKAQVASKTQELSVLNEELEKLSSHDSLTGILNRRGFEQVVESVYPLACRNKSPITLALMDLDHFKEINDMYGHAVGDLCLEAVGEATKAVFKRDSDYVGRFGGEEFIALILGDNVEKHTQLLESLRVKIENLVVEHEEESINFTISIGAYSLVSSYDESYDHLLCSADKLLYESKECGRNRVTHKSQ